MTQKRTVVTVWSPSTSRYGAPPPSPDEPPDNVRGRYTLNGKTWKREVSIDVELGGSVADAIAELNRAAAGLTGASVYVCTEQLPYGDSEYARISVNGTRKATQDEIVWVNKQIVSDEAANKTRMDAEIEAFRRKHPDLLK